MIEAGDEWYVSLNNEDFLPKYHSESPQYYQYELDKLYQNFQRMKTEAAEEMIESVLRIDESPGGGI